MSQLYLIAAAIIIFFFTRRIYQKNIELFLVILVIINFEFFQLVKGVRFSSNLKLIILPIIIAIFIEMIMKHKKIHGGKYGGWIALYFVLLINGVLISALSGQPIILGIKAIKFFPLISIYFFVVNHEIDIDKFIKYLIILALVIAGLSGLQYLTGSNIALFKLQGMQGTTRANRVTVGSFLIASAAVFSFAVYLKKKEKYYLYAFVVICIHLLFVVQTRALLVGVVLTCILSYFIYNRFSYKAIMAFVFVILVLSLGVIPFIEFEKLTIVQQTMSDFDVSGEAPSNYLGRLNTYKFYIERLKESPLVGFGFENFFFSGEYILQRKGLNLSDIGIMAFIIKTGIVGLTWLLAGLIRIIVNIVRDKELSVVGTYILLGMATIVTIDLFMIEKTIFMFGLFVGLFSNECEQRESKSRLESPGFQHG